LRGARERCRSCRARRSQATATHRQVHRIRTGCRMALRLPRSVLAQRRPARDAVPGAVIPRPVPATVALCAITALAAFAAGKTGEDKAQRVMPSVGPSSIDLASSSTRVEGLGRSLVLPALARPGPRPAAQAARPAPRAAPAQRRPARSASGVRRPPPVELGLPDPPAAPSPPPAAPPPRPAPAPVQPPPPETDEGLTFDDSG
jgi:hypothetical protein